jgi:hypothetical protein
MSFCGDVSCTLIINEGKYKRSYLQHDFQTYIIYKYFFPCILAQFGNEGRARRNTTPGITPWASKAYYYFTLLALRVLN